MTSRAGGARVSSPETRAETGTETRAETGALARRLRPVARRAVAEDVRGWLRWQESLAGFRPQRSSVDAIPFVALYAGGQLRGCVGSSEGGPRERLGRAFLSALADTRFGGVRPGDRAALVAEVSFMISPRFVEPPEVLAGLEVGTHGLGIAREPGHPVFLLPSVARDGALDAAGMLEALARKAGPEPGRHFLFETDTVVVRRNADPRAKVDPRAAAAKWLASLIRPDGGVTFAIEARTAEPVLVGRMHHGRAAGVVEALTAHGGYRSKAARAMAGLRAAARDALAGKDVTGWPGHPAEVAGTLALMVRAGVDVRVECLEYARAHEDVIARAPWHAGQVASALGEAIPATLWEACLNDLDRQPWAPWTVLGMHARGDSAGAPRTMKALRGLVASVRLEAPHKGAVLGLKFPEVAITALTVEALARFPKVAGVADAVRRGRAFVLDHQLVRGQIAAPFATTTEGAFLAAPTSSLLRGDVTAHALQALG